MHTKQVVRYCLEYFVMNKQDKKNVTNTASISTQPLTSIEREEKLTVILIIETVMQIMKYT